MNYPRRVVRLYAVVTDGAVLLLGIALFGFYVLHGLLRRQKDSTIFVADVLEQEDNDDLKSSHS